MRLNKTLLIFAVTCPLNLSLWSVSNFSNQPYYCTSLILLWLKGWMNWRVTQYEWVTIKAIFVRGRVCLYLCLCVTVSALTACLWMHVCNCVWSYPVVAGLWIRSNTHTHAYSDTRSNTHTNTYTLPLVDWVEGPQPGVTLILTTTSALPLQPCFSAIRLSHVPLRTLTRDSSYSFQTFK